MRLVRQRLAHRSPLPLSDPRAQAPDAAGTHDFLVGRVIDRETLSKAQLIARRAACRPESVLIAHGWIEEVDYVSALAADLGLKAAVDVLDPADVLGVPALDSPAVLARIEDGPALLVDAVSLSPEAVARLVFDCGWPPERTYLTTRSQLRSLHEAATTGSRSDAAIHGLRRSRPRLSARTGLEPRQMLVAMTVIGFVLGLYGLSPERLAIAISLALVPLFLIGTAIRILALLTCVKGRPSGFAATPRRADHELPRYSILVPLYREAQVLRELVAALAALDYPRTHVEVLLILEEDDIETRSAAAGLELPAYFRCVVVPAGLPRTKPKALNYGLSLAEGDLVVVYDAEDVPERDQLRQAVEAFAAGGPKLACVQGRLNVYNPRASWLTRQFAIEYSALFDALLPALERLRLPMPLGGTSNHFPIQVLRDLGGWDPFNVTEDADLGMRIARAGLETRVIRSTTWEEAPETLGPWLRQRTRWLKGWMKTLIVHTRAPVTLTRELGFRQAVGFTVILGGIVLAALVHPLCFALIVWQMAQAPAWSAMLEAPSWPLQLAVLNLIAGYATAMLLGAVAIWRRRRRRLAIHALLSPVYWLLISLAAYRALWQLARDPHGWEKTTHGLARQRELPPQPRLPSTPARSSVRRLRSPSANQ